MVKMEGQSILVVEIRYSLATRIDSLGTFLQSLKKPLIAITNSLLTKLSEAAVSIRESDLTDILLQDPIAVNHISASAA